MKQLYTKVESADKNVKDIVLKAIESSGRYAFHDKAPDERNLKSEDRIKQTDD